MGVMGGEPGQSLRRDVQIILYRFQQNAFDAIADQALPHHSSHAMNSMMGVIGGCYPFEGQNPLLHAHWMLTIFGLNCSLKGDFNKMLSTQLLTRLAPITPVMQ